MVPEQLFWRASSLKDKLSEAREANRESMRNGVKPVIGLMMWSGTFHGSKPGAGRDYSDRPAFNAYWRWNNERRDYFARAADGRIWSRNYTDNGKPEDAWITPSRPLDAADQTSTIKTYADWYADRVADRAAAVDARGVLMADWVDSMPHSNALEQDFSRPIVEDFERWAAVDMKGDGPTQWAEQIKTEHLSQWLDYLAAQYGEWWGEMVRRIEQKTGADAIMAMQKHAFPHYQRYSAADPGWMRRHVDNPSQVLYHVETWSPPSPRGGAIGNGEISAYVAQLGTHLCREPNITRGAFLPITATTEYPGEDKYAGTDQYRMIDKAEGQFGLELTDAEKTEMQRKIQRGAWMALGWTHLANDAGHLERAAMYFFTHRDKDENPYELYREVIRPIYPTRPYGPAFYYSHSIEKAFEARQAMWNPLEKLAAQAKVSGRSNVFPGYYVSDQTLEKLKPAAEPTAWLTDHVDALTEAEREKLEAIAPVYDLDEINDLPKAATPVSFEGDTTGYAFVDQNNDVIILATRDHILNERSVEATIQFHDLPDGTYQAKDLLNGETRSFTIEKGKGELNVQLERWETRAFRTTLPPDLDASR
jgi:hypothetical protein